VGRPGRAAVRPAGRRLEGRGVHRTAEQGTECVEHIKDAKVVKFELYNLRKDEKEATDLSAREPEVFERMKQAFLKLHKEVLAEGPKWELEEHRNKAQAAWPERKKEKQE
jgi:hypothetical protein